MKVALGNPGAKYDPVVMKSWKLDIEKGFLQLDPVTVIQPESWTPVMQGSSTAGSPTYTSQFGEWSQIERRVFFNCFVAISAIGGMAGNLQIAGLPLPSRNVANGFHMHVTRWSGITFVANYTSVLAQHAATRQYFDMVKMGGAGVAAANLTIGELGATSNFLVTGSYSI